MIDESDLARTDISLTCRIAPVGNVVGDLSGIVARYGNELVSAFFPRHVARKVDAALTELVNNVLENVIDEASALEVKLDILKQDMVIEVSNTVTEEQRINVMGYIARLKAAPSIRALLRETIHQRRSERLKGGLGLLRLVAENKFDISAVFEEPVLTVRAQIALGELV